MNFSRFDGIVWSVAALLMGLTGVVVFMGNQVGLEVVSISPSLGETAVSTQSQIRITFEDDITSIPEQAVSLSPPVPGTTSISTNVLTFKPDSPMLADTGYELTINEGILAENGRVLKDPVTVQFRTTHPRILFIKPDEEGPEQIFLAEPDNSTEPTQITQSATTILGFTVSPDSSQIAYASLAAGDAPSAYADLWLVNVDGSNEQMVLPCPEAACSSPVWMPDGQRIIYERRNVPNPGAPPGNPRLWWLDVSTGETLPIFADSQQLGLFPSISPDEKWISFVSPADQGIQLFNLETGEGMLVPNQMGTGVSWSADSQTVALSDIVTQDGSWSMTISKLNVYTEEVTPLKNENDSDDSNPVYSHDGQQIAFGHKQSQTAMGRQIWLMNADGTAVTPLTNNPDIHHTQFLWSPDNSTLLTQQYNIKELFTKPGVWVIDINTGEATEIAYPATQPAWLP
jgi:Tol biopolymer transport system component